MEGMSGGSSGAGGNKPKSGGTPAQGIAVNTGFYGGGGRDSSDGENDGRSIASVPTEGDRERPNLRDFLPGGGLDPKVVKRGLAGISGPDGITGPHSDIWKKVKNRYQIQTEKSTFMP